MDTKVQFIVSVLICYALVAFAKALRDIIAFRFTRSIFDYTPKWLRQWLIANKPGQMLPFDGWHTADGVVICVPMLLLIYWGNRLLFGSPLSWVVAAFLCLAILFYTLFNLNFHRWFMKADHRDL